MNSDNPILTLIQTRLQHALTPTTLSIRDDSHQHQGHLGAMGGGGHYFVTLRSQAFEGKTALQRHRMVYQALEGLIGKEIHAIQIDAKTLDED